MSGGARTIRPTTGTSVYTLLECRRAVALDLAGDRQLRRAPRPEEEFLLQRGRDHEADYVAGLGWPEPEFETADWEAGAAATRALLEKGVEGVCQGVLLADDGTRLGIPDLLRRETGDSALGAFHYVVGDVKSSSAPRSNQVLQVAFYSRMLSRLQGREPEYGYLVLKDGREERFALADYAPALQQVEREIAAIRADPNGVRPFHGIACTSCRWSEVCGPELAERDDLSLLAGMTRALRDVLEGAGIATAAQLAHADMEALVAATAIEGAYLRRLGRAAAARLAGRPLADVEPADGNSAFTGAAFLHLLRDAFDERVLWFGLRAPDGSVTTHLPSSADEEWTAFHALVKTVPARTPLVHYGRTLPAWFEHAAHARGDDSDRSCLDIEERFVDFAQRLRGSAVWPGPVFGLDDHVRFATDRDPHRSGRAAEAAWLVESQPSDVARAWLDAKGRSDLDDMAGLVRSVFSEPVEAGGESA